MKTKLTALLALLSLPALAQTPGPSGAPPAPRNEAPAKNDSAATRPADPKPAGEDRTDKAMKPTDTRKEEVKNEVDVAPDAGHPRVINEKPAKKSASKPKK